MDFEHPFLATSPDDAAIIKMAMEKLALPYTTAVHRDRQGTRGVIFNAQPPAAINVEAFRQAIVDVELDVELAIDPAYTEKFDQLRAAFAADFPFIR